MRIIVVRGNNCGLVLLIMAFTLAGSLLSWDRKVDMGSLDCDSALRRVLPSGISLVPATITNPEAEPQIIKAISYLQEIKIKIANTKFTEREKTELSNMVDALFRLSLKDAVDGIKGNPIHHSWQVANTMVEIAIGENFGYAKFKKALALAILHDIGYGQSETRKLRSSEVKAKPSLLPQYLRAREEHMEVGARVASEILDKLNQQYVQQGRQPIFSQDEINQIAEAIKLHDNPSCIDAKIQIFKYLGETLPAVNEIRQYLLPLDDILVVALHEADRLWMVSRDGLLTDLEAEPGKRTPLEQLDYNIGRFKDEYELYNEYLLDRSLMAVFKRETLFRTVTGFNIFLRESSSLRNTIIGGSFP